MVCNASFTDLSDSRVKTEIAEADVAELLQLFDSVKAKQYKRPDMNGDLGFALDDFEVEEFDGTTRRSVSTLLTSAVGCVRVSRPGWTRWKPGRPSGGQRTSRCEQDFLHSGTPAQAPFWGNK